MAQTGNLVACVKIRTESEVKAEALREAADAWFADDPETFRAEREWLRRRADRIEGTNHG